MSRLKTKNLEKCFSLLREFIEETPSVNNKKGIAALALDQLRKITAGSTPEGPEVCKPRPRVPENPED